MKRLYILLFALVFGATMFAQKADFKSAEKFASTNINKKIGSTSVRPVWLKDSDTFWYSYKTSEGNLYWMVNPAKKEKAPLFDNYYLASKITELIHKPVNHLNLPLKKLKFEDDNKSFRFEVDSFKFEYIMKTKDVAVIDTIKKEKKKEDRWKSYNKDSTWIVYAKNHNLFIMEADSEDSTEYQLTEDGERYYSFQANSSDTTKDKKQRTWVRWFKDNKKFYYTRSDSRKVEDLWVLNVLKEPRPKLETYKYAMAGDEFVPQSELWVFDVESKKGVKVETDKWKDQTLSVQLLGDRTDKLIFQRQDRTCSEIDICIADTETGESKVLFSETNKPYFNNEYTRLAIMNEGEEYLWWSERTGFGQLYLYDANGNLKNKITDGNFVVGRMASIDTTGRKVYFEGFGKEEGIDPYFTMYYSVDFDGSNQSLITKEDASHSMSMSESQKYFVDTYSRVDLAPKSVLRDNKGNVLLDLEETDLTQLYDMGWQMPTRFKTKAVDGVTDLYGVMWKPVIMEKDRKYPIISYVYPGPQTEAVPRTFTATGRYNNALANLGFIVVSTGHRGGSPQRSKYYHNFGYDNLRDYALADDKYVLEQLADRYDFVDIENVGIFGHSGGGFMSTAALLTYPDFYDVAVSSAGNHDNNIYNKWWGETHHGVKKIEKTVKKKKEKEEGDKKENEEEYPYAEENDSVETIVSFKTKIPRNQELAKNLKGHLLLVHGDVDNNVHPGNSIRMADALIKAGKRFDFMVMPGQRHGFGAYTGYFEKMMWYYFAEHLLGDYRNNTNIYLPNE